jgi:UDP-N-acetylglucosamine 2-epimerase (non-hydrolysing)
MLEDDIRLFKTRGTRKQMKVLSILGTRPEAIKMAPVIKELERYPDSIEAKVCVTGQHRQMLDQMLALFNVRYDYDLNLMQRNQSLSRLTARALEELDAVFAREQPDWILVQGDTTTAMVASLVAFYHRLKIGHIEAGLRTYDRSQPFPEEINRVIVDRLADLYFAPTERARRALLQESVDDASIRVTGNTVVDALYSVASRVPGERTWALLERIGIAEAASHGNDAQNQRVILVTAHRRENFGQPLQQICKALKKLALREKEQLRIVFPVHLNPNVQETVRSTLAGMANVCLLDPLDYEALVHILKRTYLVLTDSGGLQEEAPSFGVPVLVLRDTTERPEAVEAGTSRLVGTDSDRIFVETSRLLHDENAYGCMSRRANPFGDGRASHRIVQALLDTENEPLSLEKEQEAALALVSGDCG